jgi:hypothetical protein
MKLISWWGCGKIDQPLISGDKIFEFGIAAEPDWFTTPAVFMTVAIMTPIGLFGYWLYRQQKYLLAYIILGIYSITSLSSPGHYLFPGAMDMSLKMHSLIWLDAIAGLSLVGFILWSAAILHEWSIISERATSGGSESQS